MGEEGRRNFELRARVERFRALRSAWSALSPSCLSEERQRIGQSGRALGADLRTAARSGEALDRSDLEKLDARLEGFEREMRAVALELPLAQLHATLPERVREERRAVLDLLDLLLGAEIEGQAGTEQRIVAIDYVITQLCTTDAGSEEAFLHDPVTLTPRLYGLCEQSDVDYDPRLPEIEAEFFRAADLFAADLRSGDELRTLTRRKAELGSAYFAPGVLRSIVAYNAALSRQIAEELEGARDWGELPSEEAAPQGVLDAPMLDALADSLRRRTRGEAPSSDAVDRIAWCLDLGYPSAAERAKLLAETADETQALEARVILVGLLCRAAVVLEEEFPAVGLSPAQLEDEWVPALDEALRRDTADRLSGDDYQRACELSELKNKFLFAPMAEVHRRQRGRAPRKPAARSAGKPSGADRAAGRTAREITREALDASEAPPRTRGADWRRWPWARLARIGASVAIVLGLAAAGVVALSTNPDLAHYSREQLLQTSPFLVAGQRTEAGRGKAFVGTLDDRAWGRLSLQERREAAETLVARLRASGVRQVMLYDGERRLRVQALGSQPVRVVAGRERPAD